MSKPIILVVEDDSTIRNLITTTLEMQNYDYLAAPNGEKALYEAETHNPDVVLLDLGLPDMDGIDIIKQIRTWSMMPIIVVSARSDDADKIEALDAGADDYLTKPFSVEELLARLRVTLRRLSYIGDSAGDEKTVFLNGDLRVDCATGRVFLHDKELELTQSEYKLLVLLLKNIGKVLTYTFITQSVWGSMKDDDVASLRIYMATLRKKLGEDPSAPKYIQTHIGVGYRMIRA